jgi:GH25 family lysozyme M1 (1,4-beta-N-acetylmuramidase)
LKQSMMRFQRRGTLILALAAALAVVALAVPATARSGTKAKGIDVSRFNGAIDWPAVRRAGIKFAFIAASRGSGLDCTVRPESCGPDPLFAGNRLAARGAGVRVGAYHRAFASGATRAEARADAWAEADVFTAQVGALDRGELIPVLDVETPFVALTQKRLRTWVYAWLKRVRKRLRVRPMIYTNATSWGATGDTTQFARAGHRLWVAEWGVSRPTVPAGGWAGHGFSVWQYTSSGSVPGISGRVDLNRLGVGLGKLTVR